jgi:hypothetical protein
MRKNIVKWSAGTDLTSAADGEVREWLSRLRAWLGKRGSLRVGEHS